VRSKPPTLEAIRKAERAAVRRKALRELRKVRRAADQTGVELSEWEGEFLGGVEARVTEYGRAFADPDKGGPGQAFSALQRRKLKEIAAKAKGEAAAPGRPWRKRNTDD
jgi:hypothetical protein